MHRHALLLLTALSGATACARPASVPAPAAAIASTPAPAATPAASPAVEPAPARPVEAVVGGAAEQRLRMLRTLVASSDGDDRLDLQRRLYQTLLEQDAPAARTEALAVIEAMLASPGARTWGHTDEVLYDHGTLLLAAHRVAPAQAAWRRLLATYPASTFVPDAHLALAEAAFADGDLATAEVEYREVLRFPAARVAAYARYKLGWVHVNLGQPQDALADFVDVVGHAGEPLRREALKDVVRVYAEVGLPAQALAFFERLDPGHGAAHAARLGAFCSETGRLDAAVVAYQAALPGLGGDAACDAAVGLARVQVMRGAKPEVLTAFADLADRHPSGACGHDAEDLITATAQAWDREVRRTRMRPDVPHVLRCWALAAAVAQSPATRQAAVDGEAALRAWAH